MRRAVALVVLVAALAFGVPPMPAQATFATMTAAEAALASGRWVPSVPLELQATGRTTSSVSLGWQAVTSPVAAAQYQVSFRLPGGEWSERPLRTTTADTVPDLQMNTAYEFRVRARSGPTGPNGLHHLSDWSGIVTAATSAAVVIPAPTGVTSTSGQDRQVPVAWTASAGATSYRVEHRPVGSAAAFTGVTATSTALTLIGLTNGTTYEIRVIAVGAGGQESAPSTLVQATPRRATPPPVPTGLTATGGTRQVTASWQPVGDAELAGYRLRYRVAGTTGAFTMVDVTTSTHALTALQDGTRYELAVAAVDRSGNVSSFSATQTAITTPTTPTNLAATAPGGDARGRLTATWSAAALASNYFLEYRLQGQTAWTTVSTTTTTTTLTGLDRRRTYELRISASNTSGRSAPSAIVTAVTR